MPKKGHNAQGLRCVASHFTRSATSIDSQKNNRAVLIAPEQLLNRLLMPADFCLFLAKMEFTLRYGMTMGQPSPIRLGPCCFSVAG